MNSTDEVILPSALHLDTGRTEREELVLRFMLAYAAAGFNNHLLSYALEGTDTFLKWQEEQRNADR